MEYTWRPWQPSGNICPVCAHSHFPFCPPPPMQYYRPHMPPPPDQFFPSAVPPPYNHYAHHQGNPPVSHYPPPSVYAPPRPWNVQPLPVGDFGNSNRELNIEGDRQISVKRMRVETLEDEAMRLRLVRDHGATDLGFNRSYDEEHGFANSRVHQSFADKNGDRGHVKFGGGNHGDLASPHKHMPNSAPYASPNQSAHMHLVKDFSASKGQPLHFASPLQPLPIEPSRFKSGPSTVFPIRDSGVSSRDSHVMASESVASASIHYSSLPHAKSQKIQGLQIATGERLKNENEFSSMNNLPDKPKYVDISHILKQPYRASRPDYIVVILRGLPGSGKSYLAKILRDLEVENGGSAPRIHSIDEYFMTEIEKVEECEKDSSSGTIRSRKSTKKVIEYVYEAEMEEAYRSSMLRAFKKTLDEGAFPFVIVDDRNLRVADFAQFWATAKRSGYEVYLLEATYKDPAGCAARNVHGFTLDDIQNMAGQWEEASSLYMRLDAKALLHGDNLEGNSIQEVDMDTEETNHADEHSNSEVTNIHQSGTIIEGIVKGDSVEDNAVEVVKELEESKWSNDLDDEHTKAIVGSSSSIISVVTRPLSKKGKSVRWADQIGSIGFSICAGKVAHVSLIIGPGSGYNFKTNPMREEDKVSMAASRRSGESSVFEEQLRVERESFRAVFKERNQKTQWL